MGGTQGASIANRANPAAPLQVIGTPTYGPNYARLTNTIGFQTPFNLTAYGHTAIIIATDPIRDLPDAFGRTMGPQTVFWLNRGADRRVYWNDSSSDWAVSSSGTTAITGGPGVVRSANPSQDQYSYISLVEGGQLVRYDREDRYGITPWAVNSSGTPGYASLPYQIGARGFGDPGSFRCAAAAFYDRALPLDEAFRVWRFLWDEIGARGIRHTG
ncbi:hypothetical protein C7I55_07910 [Sphingomonas deserti]|uniref:Uncharacterized protein n=2 Tax=Allosphingosinicella deserti TaxID=2116704 RepID=A0A2P7QW25_9SPHN|nr:hypothetical protein C7I55_07910 [Sphingomonas deserti]